MMMSGFILVQLELWLLKWWRNLRYTAIFLMKYEQQANERLLSVLIYLFLVQIILLRFISLIGNSVAYFSSYVADIYSNWLSTWFAFWKFGQLLHIWISHGMKILRLPFSVLWIAFCILQIIYCSLWESMSACQNILVMHCLDDSTKYPIFFRDVDACLLNSTTISKYLLFYL